MQLSLPVKVAKPKAASDDWEDRDLLLSLVLTCCMTWFTKTNPFYIGFLIFKIICLGHVILRSFPNLKPYKRTFSLESILVIIQWQVLFKVLDNRFCDCFLCLFPLTSCVEELNLEV